MSGQDEFEVLPNRLNGEPSIFRGCSLSELTSLVIVSVLVCVPLLVIITSIFGYPMMGVGLGVMASLAMIVLGATWLQRQKRGRPIGYYQTNIRLRAERFGLTTTNTIQKSQVWDLGRTEDV